jgi:hypothetical protein
MEAKAIEQLRKDLQLSQRFLDKLPVRSPMSYLNAA